MRTGFKMTLAAAAGALFCGGLVQALNAQAKPQIYVVNEAEIIDQAGFQNYATGMQPIIQKHGGRYIIRRGKITEMEGTAPKIFTVYAFENEDKFQAWRSDPDLKKILDTRGNAAKFRSFAVEGLSNRPPPPGTEGNGNRRRRQLLALEREALRARCSWDHCSV
jgi:uncharacterized protein (DUF1330 family)